MTLNADQILALAPDASSAKAGSGLSGPAKWSNLGQSEAALWGECQGSGKDPYRTQIDLSEPAFKCSCPSRKFPCKHGLGLYLLYAAHPARFVAQTPPQWTLDWLEGRLKRSERKLDAGAAKTPEQAAASAAQTAKREEKRETKVARGLEELQTWLQDLAREGFATVRNRGPGYWDAIAARMVDAQAGAIASRLRRAGGMCFQTTLPDWEGHLGRELASIYLLSKAGQQGEALPAALQSDVRALVGWSTSQEEVLAQSGVSERWQVLAQRSFDEEKIRSRITWLRAKASGRWALVLYFAVGTLGFDKPLSVGTEFDAELVYFPGAWPVRALIKTQGALGAIDAMPASLPDLDTSLHEYTEAIALNPFLERYPLALAGVTPIMDGATLALRTADGRQLPLHPAFRHAWPLLALCGGHPFLVIGEWDGHALMPLAASADGRLFNFESDFGP